VAADVACASDDENVHGCSLLKL